MELSYGQLEATLFAHFRIHVDKRPTFKSRIKQLQRLGFPPGVNIGRGAKMEYSAAHLFQMVTAFEMIGAGLPAERATTLVSANWPCLRAAFALAVQDLNSGRLDVTLYAWVLSRAFGDLQASPYPNPSHPLEDCGGARIAIGDRPGLIGQLLRRNGQRLAHCYAMFPVSDLAIQVLKAAEEHGMIVGARLDEEFTTWMPERDDLEDGWLFLQYDPWEDGPEKRADPMFTTREIEDNLRTREMMEYSRQESSSVAASMYAVASVVIPQLTLAARDCISRGLIYPGPAPSVLQQLRDLGLVQGEKKSLALSLLGECVSDKLGEQTIDEKIVAPIRAKAEELAAAPPAEGSRKVPLKRLCTRSDIAPFLINLEPGPDIAVHFPPDHMIAIEMPFGEAIEPPAESVRTIVQAVRSPEWAKGWKRGTVYSAIYIPSEAAMSSVLQEDPEIWGWAFEQRVLLVAPSGARTILEGAADIWRRGGRASKGERKEASKAT